VPVKIAAIGIEDCNDRMN